MTINGSESISSNQSHDTFLSGIRYISIKLFLCRRSRRRLRAKALPDEAGLDAHPTGFLVVLLTCKRAHDPIAIGKVRSNPASMRTSYGPETGFSTIAPLARGRSWAKPCRCDRFRALGRTSECYFSGLFSSGPRTQDKPGEFAGIYWRF